MIPSSGETVLIVDDHEINRYATGRVLREAGYVVMEAASGQEALLKSQLRPDIVLLDVNLPDIDGFEVCRRLRANLSTAAIPIVHTSATFVSDEDRAQGLNVGADGYLTRPVEPRVLIATIRSCLRARHAELEHQKFVALVEHSRDLIAICDEHGCPSYVNQAGLKLLGLDGVSDAQGTPLQRFLLPEDLERLSRDFLPKLLSDGHGECELQVFNQKSCECHWLNCSLVVRRNEDALIGFSAVCRVITEQKRLEEELRRAASELSAANRKMNEFLATLAHELRNPMAPIRTGLEILRLTASEPETVERTRAMMERQAHQMVRLIDDLLELSRITEGKLHLRRIRVNLAEVLGSAIDATQPLIIDASHQLHTALPDSTILLEGDPNRLAQVFTNLLSNASKYTKNGGMIWLKAYQENGDAVISIRDNGLGIPIGRQDDIFKMFTQIDRSIETGYTGLGIGLTLVKKIVEMHSGTVVVHSAGSNEGSEFVVRLPIVNDVPEHTAIPLKNESGLRHRVLVVDDNRDAAETLGLVLKMLGNDICVAHDGIEALEKAASFRPSVMFLDLAMPRMNGFDTARHIRQQTWGENIVLIALTGWGQEADRRSTQDAGFNYHLTKPAEPSAIQDLLNALRRA